MPDSRIAIEERPAKARMLSASNKALISDLPGEIVEVKTIFCLVVRAGETMKEDRSLPTSSLRLKRRFPSGTILRVHEPFRIAFFNSNLGFLISVGVCFGG